MEIKEADEPLIQRAICPPILRYLKIKLLFCKKKNPQKDFPSYTR
jgi:hypothetical protein